MQPLPKWPPNQPSLWVRVEGGWELMAHMDSAELHRTRDLNLNEAYVRCGTSGLISRLNVPNSIPFLRKL